MILRLFCVIKLTVHSVCPKSTKIGFSRLPKKKPNVMLVKDPTTSVIVFIYSQSLENVSLKCNKMSGSCSGHSSNKACIIIKLLVTLSHCYMLGKTDILVDQIFTLASGSRIPYDEFAQFYLSFPPCTFTIIAISMKYFRTYTCRW